MALDFMAGCLGGCAGIVVGYPLDTIKVHIQTQDHRNPKYRGTWHCFRSLLAKDSVSGLYRGMSSPMAGVAVVNAIVFGVYSQSQRHLGEEQLSSFFLAGAAAGMAQAPICSPIELAKTRLQLDGGARFSGPMQCLRHIYRTEGLRGVSGGLGVTMMRELPSYGIYFATYEALTRSEQPISTWHMLVAGGFAGTASWIVAYPLDVVKSRLQADGEGRYAGALDCYRKSVRAEGYASMFRGLNSTIIRAFPTNAAIFAVVTWTLRLLGEEKAEGAPSRPEPPRAPDRGSRNTLDRYEESSCQSLQALGDATGSYLHQLANARILLVPARDTGPGTVNVQVAQPHFDEVHHFEWTREMLHY